MACHVRRENKIDPVLALSCLMSQVAKHLVQRVSERTERTEAQRTWFFVPRIPILTKRLGHGTLDIKGFYWPEPPWHTSANSTEPQPDLIVFLSKTQASRTSFMTSSRWAATVTDAVILSPHFTAFLFWEIVFHNGESTHSEAWHSMPGFVTWKNIKLISRIYHPTIL